MLKPCPTADPHASDRVIALRLCLRMLDACTAEAEGLQVTHWMPLQVVQTNMLNWGTQYVVPSDSQLKHRLFSGRFRRSLIILSALALAR